MDELVNQVAQRTGISQDQARQTLSMVSGAVKQRLPEPLGSQIESVSSGQTPDLGGLAGNLGGLFGRE